MHQFNTLSIAVCSDLPIEIIVGIVYENGQTLNLQLIPEDGTPVYQSQGNRYILPLGNEKLDGEWHEWEAALSGILPAEATIESACVVRLEINGEAFCLGPAMSIYDTEEGEPETSYIASFSEKKDSLQDYGWMSPFPIECEYTSSEESEIAEGYLCLTKGQTTKAIQTPKIPYTMTLPPLGTGPLMSVTMYAPAASQIPPFAMLPQAITPFFQRQYSTPINPFLAFGLIKSLPLYLDAQYGAPYSVKQNIFSNTNPLPAYPASFDYTSDPEFAYLSLNPLDNTTISEASNFYWSAPYYP